MQSNILEFKTKWKYEVSFFVFKVYKLSLKYVRMASKKSSEHPINSVNLSFENFSQRLNETTQIQREKDILRYPLLKHQVNFFHNV